MHNQTDQRKSPMRAGHARNLASRVGSGGKVRAGVSPAASTLARWRDAYGQRYVALGGDYTPGQFSPTGSQMLGPLRSNDVLSRAAENPDTAME